MDQLADHIDRAAETLATMDRRVPGLLPAAAAFGADDAGRPGRVGQRLHQELGAVLRARADEAAGLARRLSDLSDAVRSSARDYAETDTAVQHRFLRGL
ncbi:type VII secretion target [Actinoplanes oblitus]|uniref:Type VII secretion target n=1 Tax=Actinoplanes oblitus TaxID=3040509 RepID=A0ABY8WM34_9ACTN|nr:type VII secretion target [Actinoplanes oblitus]WIM96825.1 type VII secretion target [Actinoplanes oblitus]